MKIATWNIERLRHRKSRQEIVRICEDLRADILVLTETDEQICPKYKWSFQTPKLHMLHPKLYQPTENRVSIFTNYECVRKHTTFDETTALCVELETERGRLLVYGTIIGILGNRHPSFKQDLLQQMHDFKRLSNESDGICICGDYNCSFRDNYYFTQFGRSSLLQSFRDNRISILTSDAAECIDHIAISERFIKGASISIEEWNQEKFLSDHKGIMISLK